MTALDTPQPAAPDPALEAYNARRFGFAAGVVAALVMLVAIVLLRLASGAISLPEIVADGFLLLLPGAVFSTILDSLQRSAKPIMYLGVAVGWRVLIGGKQMGADSDSLAVGASPSGAVANDPPFDVAGLSAELTSTDDFYQVSKNFIDPSVSASGWKLSLSGLVDRPMELTYDQLRALPASEGIYALMCISNEVGGEYWGNAHWKGVKLSYLLEQAGVHTDAYKAVFTAADDYKDSVKLQNALHPEALLAWEMNGQPLRKEHGFPARLLIPGIYGMKNVKWLNGISIVNEDVKGFWQNQGWDDDAPYQIASRIDVPRPRATIATGPLDVAGVAFAGDRGIQKVEVSTDAGKTWQEAQVKPRLSPQGWQLWRGPGEVGPGGKEQRGRATDGTGRLQPREPNPPFPSGSTGHHTVNIAVT